MQLSVTPEEIVPVAEQAAEYFRQAALTFLATAFTEGVPAEHAFLGIYAALICYLKRSEVLLDALQAAGNADEALWLLGLEKTGETWEQEFNAKVREIREAASRGGWLESSAAWDAVSESIFSLLAPDFL